MIKELDARYHHLISQAESTDDLESVAILKAEYESKRRTMTNDNSDESYFGDFYQKTVEQQD